MLLHSLAPLTRSSAFAATCASASSPSSRTFVSLRDSRAPTPLPAGCVPALGVPVAPPPHLSNLPSVGPRDGLSSLQALLPPAQAVCPTPIKVATAGAARESQGAAGCSTCAASSQPTIPLLAGQKEQQEQLHERHEEAHNATPVLGGRHKGKSGPEGTRSSSVLPHTNLPAAPLSRRSCPSAGGASQLRASHVASASHRELLRISPGWSTLHCSTTLHRRRPSLPLLPQHSSGIGNSPSNSCSSPSGLCSPSSSLSAASCSSSSSFTLSPPHSSPRPSAARRPLSHSRPSGAQTRRAGWHGRLWLQDWLLHSDTVAGQKGNGGLVHEEVLRCLAAAGAAHGQAQGDAASVGSVGDEGGGERAGDGAQSTEEDWASRRETDFSVARVAGDGRCLFSAVAHGMFHAVGIPVPSSYIHRCFVADKLRSLVAQEFVKRREETEWFLEGEFEDYVANIQKPHVWGGEPELLMLAHALKYPVSVYILDPKDESFGNAIISIADYGKEYFEKGASVQEVMSILGSCGVSSESLDIIRHATDKPRPICVLYNGYNHFDALQFH